MVVAGVVCALTGIAYYFLTQDTPAGNFRELARRRGGCRTGSRSTARFCEACRDPRVWALFVLYGACFGIELTIDNMAALYFVDYFPELASRWIRCRRMSTAGLTASCLADEHLRPHAGRHRSAIVSASGGGCPAG